MRYSFRIALAPLAGVTDRAFRQICKKFGADIVTTEMISSKGMHYNDKKTLELLSFDSCEQPIGVQLFGSDPDIMCESALKVEQLGFASIDLNMGCPVTKIVSNGDGSALMKNPKLASDIISAIVESVKVPVSVKFRAGFDSAHINAVEFAKMCEASGASVITVHGRTREQMYSGKADWDIIRRVKQAVSIPVYGNGDIFTPHAAIAMRDFTDCDGVTIARGALGYPFIFSQIKEYMTDGTYTVYSDKQRLEFAIEHISAMCRYKGERIAIPEARKHMAWYLKGMSDSSEYKNRIFKADTLDGIKLIVDEYLQTR